MLPPVDLRPPFNITRTSHIVLTSPTLKKSRDFYVKIVGLVVTEETDTVLSARAGRSLPPQPRAGADPGRAPTCRAHRFPRLLRRGPRRRLHAWFRTRACRRSGSRCRTKAARCTSSDPIGTHARAVRAHGDASRAHAHQVRAATRAPTPSVWTTSRSSRRTPTKSCEFYSELGFRNSEYLAHGDKLLGAFMYRKGTCLDLAIVENAGPKMHHFAYTVSERT